jgi:hypothetical protein
MGGGFFLDQILAEPGDVVRFGRGNFHVNGVSKRIQMHMPNDGGIHLAENQWFIWPKFDINGNAPELEVTRALQNYSIITQKEIIGKPLQRWFWRKQKLP